MAGLKGKSGPPGNMNAFKHGLAPIQKRREEHYPEDEEGVNERERLDGQPDLFDTEVDRNSRSDRSLPIPGPPS
jgi:hypothetical protein